MAYPIVVLAAKQPECADAARPLRPFLTTRAPAGLDHAAAPRLRHDVSSVPSGDPLHEVLRPVRCVACLCLPVVRGSQSSREQVLRPMCSTARQAGSAALRRSRVLHPQHLAEKILTSKAALEGERKQVTVLFADLKGSMELLADRDPEEARKLLDPARARSGSGDVLPEEFIGINMRDGPFVNRAQMLALARAFREGGGRLVRLTFPETQAQRFGDVVVLYGRFEAVFQSGVGTHAAGSSHSAVRPM